MKRNTIIPKGRTIFNLLTFCHFFFFLNDPPPPEISPLPLPDLLQFFRLGGAGGPPARPPARAARQSGAPPAARCLAACTALQPRARVSGRRPAPACRWQASMGRS